MQPISNVGKVVDAHWTGKTQVSRLGIEYHEVRIIDGLEKLAGIDL